ncbi:putative serine/threonine-protein kinase [Senna tora]|uniref:Putative serine/threonine-protein kinase n=1 Tax=Senna tora TaxID=362788 RepID=A0A834TI74_9FABA|nr:putative serine/threonine-protein kinase [Senna tora]
MDLNEGTSFCRDEKVEAMDLLEEFWFFDNLLNTRKPKMMMPRCYSDPCPSSALETHHVHVNMKHCDNNGAQEDDDDDDQKESRNRRLMRQPSDPTVLQAADFSTEMKQVKKSSESNNNGRRSKLLRTPSLPPSIGREDKFQVCDHRNGRSPKHPSLSSHIDTFPPKQTSKSYSIPRSRTYREGESSMSREGIREMRRRYLKQRTMRKSLSDLEFEEVQGFKDLGFSFEKETVNTSVASILPGLQVKSREETEEDRAVRRPYLSEAWMVQSCAPPPIPNYTSNKSSKDMKAHIKFWARAVASNVRQEC